MFVIPTLYMKGGRLIAPASDRPSILSLSAPELVQNWKSSGIVYIHVVDLDVPTSGHSPNEGLLREIVQQGHFTIQLEGAFKSVDVAERYISIGCTRLILGAIAYQQPAFLTTMCERFPGKIAVHIDVKADKVVIKGWTVAANKKASDYAHQFKEAGVSLVLYSTTDVNGAITTDGIEKTGAFLRETHMPTIFAGDVENIGHIEALRPLEKNGLIGIQLNRSIYDGVLDVRGVARLMAEYEMESGEEPTLIPD